MRERRSARVGTVGGLSLLGGGTAVAAVAGGTHSIFSTILLGMLAVGMGHALLTELQRQARRSGMGGWAAQDTINTVLLASWAGGALTATMLAVAPRSVRAVGLILAFAYAVSCAYFVAERWRTVTTAPSPLSEPAPPAPEPERQYIEKPTVPRPAPPELAPHENADKLRSTEPA